MAEHPKTGTDPQSQNRPSRGAYESYESDDGKSGRRQSPNVSPDARVQDDGRKKQGPSEGYTTGRAQHGEDLGDVRPDPAVERSTPKLTND